MRFLALEFTDPLRPTYAGLCFRIGSLDNLSRNWCAFVDASPNCGPRREFWRKEEKRPDLLSCNLQGVGLQSALRKQPRRRWAVSHGGTGTPLVPQAFVEP